MSLSIIKCFSIFVASEHSERCNEFKFALRDYLNCLDKKTGLSRAYVYRHGKEDPKLRDDFFRIGREAAAIANKCLQDIPPFFYGPDAEQKSKENN